MKKKSRKSRSKDVAIAVTQKDYDRDIRAGVTPEETLRPGTYRGRRGGFLERHPETLTEKIETKIGIYIKLDRDILQFFKERAKQPNAAAYQTQINNALRAYIEGNNSGRDLSACSTVKDLLLLWPNVCVERFHRQGMPEFRRAQKPNELLTTDFDGVPPKNWNHAASR